MTVSSSASVGFADLATNVLAIVVAALLLVSALPEDRSQSAREQVAAAVIVDRRPLDGAAMIAHLAARRAGSGEVSVDLLPDAVRIAGPGGRTTVAPGDGVGLLTAVGRPNGPVRLDVFSNRHHAFVAGALARAGIVTTELSVPAALRTEMDDEWSIGFQNLTDRAATPAEFRAGLAALLAARDRPPTAPPSASGEAKGALDLVSRFGKAAGIGLGVFAVLGAAAVIVLVERRQMRASR